MWKCWRSHQESDLLAFYTSVCHQKITTDTTEFKYFEADTQDIIRPRNVLINFYYLIYIISLSYRIQFLLTADYKFNPNKL